MGLGPLGLRFDAGALADASALGLFAYAMLAIGPIEELAKLLPFLVVIIRFDEFDEELDGIIYASFIALGYAAVENWQYREFLTPLEAVARGFASPIVHILFASVWGHWIAQAHLNGRSIALGATAGFAIAAALHPRFTGALFFVARGDGTHQFSRTLDEHNQAVIKYQLGGDASRLRRR